MEVARDATYIIIKCHLCHLLSTTIPKEGQVKLGSQFFLWQESFASLLRRQMRETKASGDGERTERTEASEDRAY